MSSPASTSRRGGGRPGLGITQSIVLGQRNAMSMRVLVGDEVGTSPGGVRASEKWIWLTTFRKNLTYGSTDPDVPDISELENNEKEAIDLIRGLDRPSREAERMTTILADLGRGFQAMKDLGTIVEDEDEEEEEESADKNGKDPPPDATRVSELLLTLRDFVGERIDYAKAFVAIGGLSLLLGGAAERVRIPRNVRSTCLRVLADLVQLNRSVQYSLLDNDGVRALAAIYFAEFVDAETNNNEGDDGKIRGRVVKTMGAAVCGHPGAERMFCTSPEARKVIESGVGMHQADESLPAPPVALRRQCLAFLCDLLGPAAAKRSSDYGKRVERFTPVLEYIAGTMLDDESEPDWECRELTIKTLRYVARNERGAINDSMKETIATCGAKRVEKMKALDRAESNASVSEQNDEELYLWKTLTESLEKP
eukprot:CAMPEP_0178545222 /NCGR_PEP_ID=MMETSP0697-20121206/3528_1 /TAXON_ID=265572 /ORGANISM="Extubocellulus spinifer, Strain CCMP396" /LENGTH=423 /DNA_ID=CAMNT_0020177777 /DNA_START=4 /DNA_END=1275 /DNA_ORIENTATION=-